ncbi:MAG: PEGA domain-containing protein [Polyangiaceae bacterium]|nr:PEGA domain-containing protein [Polyangiaceae bacterium]
MTRLSRFWIRQTLLAALVAGLIVCCLSPRVWAAPEPTSPPEQEAQEHFDKAVVFSEQGLFAEALVELRRAFQAAPHYAVLYNIGLVYVALGDPVQAITNFKEYLRQGGAAVAAERRKQVEQEIVRQRARLGSIDLRVKPDGATVSVDGKPLGTSPLPELELGVGLHALTASMAGHESVARSVALRGGEHVTVNLTLPPAPAPGELLIRCSVPDVAVVVDGQPVTRTPLAQPLLLSAGLHQLAFERRGYTPTARQVTLTPQARWKIDCGVRPLAPIPDALTARLMVHTSVPGARVTVNGLPLNTSRLPVGRHQVEVRAPGFETWSRQVLLRKGEQERLAPTLTPLKPPSREAEAMASRYRGWVWALGGTGLAFGGAAVGLGLVAKHRWDDYLRHQADLDPLLFAGQGSPQLQEQQAANDRRHDAAHRWELAAVGAGAVAITATTVAALLYLSERDSVARAKRNAARWTLAPTGCRATW